MPKPYQIILQEAFPFGVLIGVQVPPIKEPVPDNILHKLRPNERRYAEGLSGFRQMNWVAGRIAMHKAIGVLGIGQGDILTGPYGEPLLPEQATGSISHKDGLVVAFAARSKHGHIGVDLEDGRGPARNVAEKVLTAEELRTVRSLPEERQWAATLMRFSIKEAVYKALFPYVRRYVGFREAHVDLEFNGPCRVKLNLEENEGPFRVEARLHWVGDRILSVARIRREDPNQKH
jgi:4'-phosphopantetheinyl transferase EntD